MKLLMSVLLFTALPLAAELPDDESIEVEVEVKVKVITQTSVPADCLAAVAVDKIDGEKRLVPAQGFLIEPGIHTINGHATLDITHCDFAGGDLQMSSAEDLEVNFEAGKTYYIAYDYKSANTEEWKLVVWVTE